MSIGRPSVWGGVEDVATFSSEHMNSVGMARHSLDVMILVVMKEVRVARVFLRASSSAK